MGDTLSTANNKYLAKYDGLENIDLEIRSRAMGVTLVSSTGTNSGHNHSKV
jgi:hypothetical protein